MTRSFARFHRLALLVPLALLLPAPGNGAPYQRRWYVLAGGGAVGGTDIATGYRLSGTVGQPVAAERHPGSYEFITGFWSGPFGSAFVGVEPAPLPARTPFRIHAAVPNPTRGDATIGYDLPATRAVTIRVLDLQGRTVRTLAHVVTPAGSRSVTWDGRDDAGAPAPKGLYFVSIDAGQDRGVTRLVLLAEGGAR